MFVAYPFLYQLQQFLAQKVVKQKVVGVLRQ